MPSKNEMIQSPGPSGALPGGGQAQGQAPFGSASPDAIFGALMQGMPQVSQQDIQSAITPISGRGPVQMPSYFSTPRAQINPPAQLNKEQVIGAGNARAQGIGNAVSATTRMIGNVVALRKNQRQEADATRVQQLLSAQYSVDSAQQQLKGMSPSDPGYAEIQKQAKDSQNLIAGLMQDPKFVSQVEKGFQISLTDPSQNKTPDHNMVQRGLDLFKKKHQENISQEQAQQMAQKFSQSQPKQLQPNVQAQQQLQMKMEMQKTAAQIARSYVPIMVQQMKLSQSEALLKAREMFTSQMKYADAVRAFQLARYQRTSRRDDAFALQAQKQRDRLSYLNHDIMAHATNPVYINGLVSKENDEYNKEQRQNEGTINQYQQQITHIVNGPDPNTAASQQRIKELRDDMEGLRSGWKSLDLQHAQALASINSLILKEEGASNAGGFGGGNTGSGESDTSNPDSTPSGEEDDDLDFSTLDPSLYDLPQ